MNNFFCKGKTIFVFCLLFCITGYVIYCFGKLAVTPVEERVAVAQEQDRGTIADRTGSPLAVQTIFYNIGISPKSVKESQRYEVAQDIGPILEMDPGVLLTILEDNSTRSYVTLKKKVDQTVYVDLKAIAKEKGYNFITYDKIPGRVYPNGSMASQLIGFMGSEGKGLSGIELTEDSVLSGKDNKGNVSDPHNVFLTIDANLQYKLEQISYKTMENTGAESMMLVAVNTKTGEILSYISLPDADLNDYGNAPDMGKVDRPAVEAYEPGSVFKIFTVAMAYDEGRIKANDSFLCDKVYEAKTTRETIKINCLDYHGWLTPKDALRYSCNDVLGQISDRMNETEFVDKIRSLGFGTKTGVELPGESTGSVKDNTSRFWSARSKPTMAIGQELSVTALQMVQAATAFANEGVPVKLSFINKITNKDGTVVYSHTPEYKDRLFRKSTAEYILSCMESTATSGTGSRANLNDVKIGVKTGTAQMADHENGGYSSTDFLSNCMAIFPIENPEILLYIVVQKAKGETYAGRIVAPVIAEAASVIIDHMGMSRGGAASLEHNGRIVITGQDQVEIGDTVPDFSHLTKRDLLPLTERTDININMNGSGWVVSQTPEPGTPVTENMTIELYLE